MDNFYDFSVPNAMVILESLKKELISKDGNLKDTLERRMVCKDNLIKGITTAVSYSEQLESIRSFQSDIDSILSDIHTGEEKVSQIHAALDNPNIVKEVTYYEDSITDKYVVEVRTNIMIALDIAPAVVFDFDKKFFDDFFGTSIEHFVEGLHYLPLKNVIDNCIEIDREYIYQTKRSLKLC